ncbi:MAG: hypothetical protein OJF51_001439 [Nitrospira sp.]|nr:MAG: hypothetical protein OJF51_001439 [Nitrospira sp.]
MQHTRGATTLAACVNQMRNLPCISANVEDEPGPSFVLR